MAEKESIPEIPRPDELKRKLEFEMVTSFLKYRQGYQQWLEVAGSGYGPDGDSINGEAAWVSDENVNLYQFRNSSDKVINSLQISLGVPGRPYNLYEESPESVRNALRNGNSDPNR